MDGLPYTRELYNSRLQKWLPLMTTIRVHGDNSVMAVIICCCCFCCCCCYRRTLSLLVKRSSIIAYLHTHALAHNSKTSLPSYGNSFYSFSGNGGYAVTVPTVKIRKSEPSMCISVQNYIRKKILIIGRVFFSVAEIKV